MNALALASTALGVIALRAFYVRHASSGMQCLWQFGAGLLSVDLRRRALLARVEHDSQDFPQPRELRVLTFRVAGIPFWFERCMEALPLSVDARIDSVCAEEFDHLFGRRFQQTRAECSVRTLLAA